MPALQLRRLPDARGDAPVIAPKLRGLTLAVALRRSRSHRELALTARRGPGLAGPEAKPVIAVPLASFLPGAPILTLERDVREWRIRYGAYELAEMAEGPAVWGATARILGQLGAILAG